MAERAKRFGAGTRGRGWLIAGASVVLLALLLIALMVPPLSNLLVSSALVSRGAGPATVEGAFLSPFGARVAAAKLGPGPDVTLEGLVVDFTPIGILSGQISRVSAKSVTASGKWERGAFVPPLASAAGTGASAGTLVLPSLPPIDVAQLRLTITGFEAPLGFVGHVATTRETTGGQRLKVDGTVYFVAAYSLEAALTDEGQGNAQLLLSAAPAGEAPIPEEFRADIPPPAGLRLLAVRLVQSGGALSEIDARLDLKALSAPMAHAEDISAQIKFPLAAGGGSGLFSLAARAVKPTADGRTRLRAELAKLQVLSPQVRQTLAALLEETAPGELQATVNGAGAFTPAKGSRLLDLNVVIDAPFAALSAGRTSQADLHTISLRIAPRGGANGALIFDAPGKSLAVRDLEASLRLQPTSGPADLALGVEVPTAELTYGEAVRVQMKDARLSASGALYEGIEAERLSADFTGLVAQEPAAWRVRPVGGCLDIVAERLLVAALVINQAGVKACADEGKGILSLSPEGELLSAGTYVLKAALVAAQGLSATGVMPSGAYEVAVDEKAATVKASVAAGPLVLDPGSAESRVRLQSVAADAELELKDGALQIRWPNIRGRIIDATNPERFAPVDVAGEMALAGGALEGDFSAQALGRAIGSATLKHDLAAGRGSASLDVPGVRFARKGLQLQALVPALRGAVTGAEGLLAAKGRIAWVPGQALNSQGEVSFARFGVTTAYGRIEGIDGNMAFIDLLKPRTAAPQRLTIAATNVGLPLANGEVLIDFPGDGRLLIPEAKWPWSGGHLAIVDGIIDPKAETQTLAMRAEAIDLTEVFRLLDIAGLEGSGVVDGRLPIEVRNNDAYVVAGRLAARSGGVLKYTGEAAAAAASGGEGASLLFTALENFIYDTLEIGIEGRLTGVIDVAIKLRGHNPDVFEGYPFELNIAIKSELANLLLESTKGLRIPEDIRRTLTESR